MLQEPAGNPKVEIELQDDEKGFGENEEAPRRRSGYPSAKSQVEETPDTTVNLLSVQRRAIVSGDNSRIEDYELETEERMLEVQKEDSWDP